MVDLEAQAVFLDRDGVILKPVIRGGNLSVPHSLEEVEILPGVADSLSALKNAGFLVFVVTNQPEVSRGTVSRKMVELVNEFMASRLPWIDGIGVCYHDDSDCCLCRKPKPGMILRLTKKHQIKKALMVGDRWRDIEAGIRANCYTILIDNGLEVDDQKPKGYKARFSSLFDATPWILEFFTRNPQANPKTHGDTNSCQTPTDQASTNTTTSASLT